MSVSTKTNNTFEMARVTGAHITTADYKGKSSGGKFERKVQRKQVYLTVDEEADQKALQEFGMTLYTPKTPDATSFFTLPFAGQVMVYDEQTKTKSPVVFDNNKDNFKGDNIEVAITKGESAEGQTMYRVSALKYTPESKFESFGVAFFDESDDEYTRVSSDPTPDIPLIDGDAPTPLEDSTQKG